MIIKWGFWLCTYFGSVFGRHISLFNREIDSWISESDYQTMLRESFPFARCCNVFINGTTVVVEQSFEYFVRSYPNDYTIMRRTYDCNGYLLIASDEERLLSALAKVPSTISTTELLIIFDDDLPEDSKLFNGYEDLRYDSGVGNFKGRVLQAAAYYNPPMCYLNKTVRKTIKGVEAEIFLAEDDIERDGFEFKIFMLIAERLNFSWAVRQPSGKFRYGRRINNDTWKGGMIGQLVTKEIDIAFSGIWLKEDHNVFTNLSIPFGQLLITFLVPRPKPYTSFWALTRPFTPLVWAIIFIILICQTCYMTIRSRLNPRGSTKRFQRFSITCTELTGRLLGIWAPRKIAGAKIQLQFWHTAGLIIVTAYSSSLAARLAGSEYEERINTVQQFLEADLTWGRQGPVPIFNEFFDLRDKYSSMIPQRFESERSSEDRHRKILKGNYAIIGRVVGGVFFPEDSVSNDDLHNYRMMTESVGAYYSCFAVQPWLLDKINKMMLWSIEAGFTNFHLKDVIRRRAGSSLREVLIEHDRHDGTVRVLAFTPLASGFAMLFTGLIISSVVFYMEMKSTCKNTSMVSMSVTHSKMRIKKKLMKH